MINRRDYYFQRKKQYPNNEYVKNIYDKCNKLVKQNIKKFKKKYFENSFADRRNIWRTINFALYNKYDNKKIENKSIIINNSKITNTTEICEHFNSFFVSIGQELANKIPQSQNKYYEKLNINSMILYPTNELEIRSIISKLNTKKSSGYDNISVNMIQKSAYKLSTILKVLINKSFVTGQVPNNSKIAKIIPIFKNGNKELVNNYRPISILPVLSKVIEKVMNQRLTNFLEQSDFFYPNQYGFRKNSNCETAVLDIVSDIQINLDKQNVCGIISLDLCKAFDTVDHKILLNKMYDIGIRGNAYHWFENYLSNRYQFVYSNNYQSSYKKIICGVPQGSVLAPNSILNLY